MSVITDWGAYKQGGGNARAALYNLGGYDEATMLPQLEASGHDFAAQFKNLVGRDPTQEELGSFFTNVVANLGFNPYTSGRGLELQQRTQNYIGTNYAQDAQDIATQKLQDQQGQANQLAELFRSQGNQAINSTQQGLLDFQQKLFDRLRPNLITSLQAQGLLNSGGLNEAVAGAQKDLADQAQGQLLDARLQNEQAANQIAFAGASAPYEFQQAQALAMPDRLMQAQQAGLNNAYNTYQNQLNFQNQQALQRQLYEQNAALGRKSGGFFSNFGSAFAPSLGQSLGSNLASWVNAGQQGQTNNAGDSQFSPLKSLFMAGH